MEYIHYVFTEGFVSVRRGLCMGVCLGIFVWKVLSGVVLSVPLLLEYIRYNRKLNIIFNFRFHMYEKNFKSVTSHALGPLPLSQTVTPSRTPPPRAYGLMYFMDGLQEIKKRELQQSN